MRSNQIEPLLKTALRAAFSYTETLCAQIGKPAKKGLVAKITMTQNKHTCLLPQEVQPRFYLCSIRPRKPVHPRNIGGGIL